MWQATALNLLPLLINDGDSERQLSQTGSVNLTPLSFNHKVNDWNLISLHKAEGCP